MKNALNLLFGLFVAASIVASLIALSWAMYALGVTQ